MAFGSRASGVRASPRRLHLLRGLVAAIGGLLHRLEDDGVQARIAADARARQVEGACGVSRQSIS